MDKEFYFELGDKVNLPIKYRYATRAVILKDNQILMVHSNRDGYKFPGGGACPNETIEETLIRETKEEVGYQITKVIRKIGSIITRNIDSNDDSLLFEMTSDYFLCEIDDYIHYAQKLDDYEKDLGFTPKYINIDEAINYNTKNLNKFAFGNNLFASNEEIRLKRELLALKQVKEIFYAEKDNK